MQDISRDDFNLLNGECSDKDCLIVRNNINTTSTIPVTTHLPVTSSPSNIITDGYNVCSSSTVLCSHQSHHNTKSPNLESVGIKLEDSNNSDLYNSTSSWHHPHTTEIGTSKLLLRNSDDPLISRGAACVDDDNPNELKSIVASVNSTETSPMTLNSTNKQQKQSLTAKKIRTTNLATQPRTRRKGAFKLRFHHQALPPEYLSHYEATQNQLNIKQNSIAIANDNNNEKTSTDNINTLNKKLILNTSSDKSLTNSHDNVRNWLQKIAEMQEAAAAKEAAEIAVAAGNVKITPNDRIEAMEIRDDLDNFGSDLNIENVQKTSQIVPKSSRIVQYSDLPYMGEMTLENSKPRRGRKPKKADICHLIYKNYGTIFPGTPKDFNINEDDKPSILAKKLSEKRPVKGSNDNNIIWEEPLNLCLRDQSESFTISSDEEESCEDFERSNNTTPLESAIDPITDNLLATNLKMSLPNFQKTSKEKNINQKCLSNGTKKENPSSPNYGYWPNAGIFIHPMALYYQKMIDSGNLQSTSQRSSPSATNSSLSLKQASPKPQIKMPLTSKKDKLDHPEACSTPSSVKSSNSSVTGSSTQPPQKRKRSAIFIPPMPAENTTNPPTEVSICKFKFTGGAKPSLQEKKMLSVDSDGNYRYYSGTGDKSTRGYEFFPRESLQQSGVVPGVNCSGAFLNATGEKISLDLPPPSAGLSNELLQIPDTPPGALLLPSMSTKREHRTDYSHDRKKRKSKRSIQREKLEQTFKDKGFLIQTQQLESAEGATYCKFRQLKKFTRYLFRSWKDYLPGDVQHAQAAAAAAALVSSGNSTTPAISNQENQQSATIASIRNLVESNSNKSLTAGNKS